MKDWNDDPRLTAYALGELEEAERAAFEAELASDPRGSEALEAVRATAEALAGELASEAVPALEASERNRIAARAAEGAARPRLLRRVLWVGGAVAAGAAAVLAIITWTQSQAHRRHPHTYSLFGSDGADVTASNPPPGSASPPAARRAFGSRSGQPGARYKNASRAYVVDFDVQVAQGASTDGLDLQFAYRADEKPFEERLRDMGYVEEAEVEEYEPIVENPFVAVADDPRSTFSIDVDTASYANVRRFLNDGQLPPPDAVRIEEMINYFPYDYPAPAGDRPFAVSAEVADCPWAPDHRLVRIGLMGKPLPVYGQKDRNLVFLIDVSGSMQDEEKLPLLKKAMRLLVENLGESDRVSLVVYAGAAGVVLEPTPCDRKEQILAAIEELEAGGSTNGGQGIHLAYALAQGTFLQGGVNRVILATDGDFNVGVTEGEDLETLIEHEAKSGVFLSVLGFGKGNLKDSKMEQLANHGNGNYAYVDSLLEAQKVLVREMGGTLETVAKDVKIQVEFNPAQVAGFRLVGYENRMLAHADFDDDSKDAGEIGAGHRVTALYEVVPAGMPVPVAPSPVASAEDPAVAGDLAPGEREMLQAIGYAEVPGEEPAADEEPQLRYGAVAGGAGPHAGELLFLRLRYKEPQGQTSRLIEASLVDEGRAWSQSSDDFRWAAGVAAFGMWLRGSQHTAELGLGQVRGLAQSGAGPDPWGYRSELLRLVDRALALENQR